MLLVSFYTPLKTSENQRFSDFFRGIESDQWHEMGFKNTETSLRYGRKKKNSYAVFCITLSAFSVVYPIP